MKNVPGFEDVEKAVIELRGKKIILDSEVAKLYGVTTREINQAVKNNPEKFPAGYILKRNLAASAVEISWLVCSIFPLF